MQVLTRRTTGALSIGQNHHVVRFDSSPWCGGSPRARRNTGTNGQKVDEDMPSFVILTVPRSRRDRSRLRNTEGRRGNAQAQSRRLLATTTTHAQQTDVAEQPRFIGDRHSAIAARLAAHHSHRTVAESRPANDAIVPVAAHRSAHASVDDERARLSIAIAIR